MKMNGRELRFSGEIVEEQMGIAALSYCPMKVRPGSRLLFTAVLGLWISLTVCMAYIAGANFKTVEPDNLRHAAEVFAEIPEGEERRMDLRYIASELNRHFFKVYDGAQLVLATLSLLLLFLSRAGKLETALTLTCCAFAIWFAFRITPNLIEIGRQIDFMPREPEPPQVKEFYGLHRQAVAIEVIKLLFLTTVVLVSARRAQP